MNERACNLIKRPSDRAGAGGSEEKWGESVGSSEWAVFPAGYCAALSGFLDTALFSEVQLDFGPCASGPSCVDYAALVFSLVGSLCRSS
jgi:hypothetical protein